MSSRSATSPSTACSLQASKNLRRMPTPAVEQPRPLLRDVLAFRGRGTEVGSPSYLGSIGRDRRVSLTLSPVRVWPSATRRPCSSSSARPIALHATRGRAPESRQRNRIQIPARYRCTPLALRPPSWWPTGCKGLSLACRSSCRRAFDSTPVSNRRSRHRQPASRPCSGCSTSSRTQPRAGLTHPPALPARRTDRARSVANHVDAVVSVPAGRLRCPEAEQVVQPVHVLRHPPQRNCVEVVLAQGIPRQRSPR